MEAVDRSDIVVCVKCPHCGETHVGTSWKIIFRRVLQVEMICPKEDKYVKVVSSENLLRGVRMGNPVGRSP